jgi:hypothetical protein
MFGCGGDRRFFKTYDIMPAEFLALVWRHEHDAGAIVDWVARRIAAAKTSDPRPQCAMAAARSSTAVCFAARLVFVLFSV